MTETGLEFWSLAMCFILKLLLATKKTMARVLPWV